MDASTSSNAGAVAGSNKANDRADDARGGALVDNLRWARIKVMKDGSSVAAMIFMVPPQWRQYSMSISKTRFSSRAQLMRGQTRLKGCIIQNIYGFTDTS